MFNFENDGSVSSSDVENQSSDSQHSSEQFSEIQARKAKKRMTRQAEAAAILNLISINILVVLEIYGPVMDGFHPKSLSLSSLFLLAM